MLNIILIFWNNLHYPNKNKLKNLFNIILCVIFYIAYDFLIDLNCIKNYEKTDLLIKITTIIGIIYFKFFALKLNADLISVEIKENIYIFKLRLLNKTYRQLILDSGDIKCIYDGNKIRYQNKENLISPFFTNDEIIATNNKIKYDINIILQNFPPLLDFSKLEIHLKLKNVYWNSDSNNMQNCDSEKIIVFKLNAKHLKNYLTLD